MGMVEEGEQCCFTLEAGQSLGVPGHLAGQDLDRHLATQLRVASAVDLAHTPGPEGLKDLIGAQAVSRR
jgi:hypothetical protein